MSVIIGVDVNEAVLALPEERQSACAEFVAHLSDTRKPVRAAALAFATQEIATAAAEITLR
ncbi:MAG: hypothetical protein FWD73_06840 [Polyangiaceae bacterium]|nr:hypothetical protein [Polyangiaceae bacterium]